MEDHVQALPWLCIDDQELSYMSSAHRALQTSTIIAGNRHELWLKQNSVQSCMFDGQYLEGGLVLTGRE